MHQLSPPQTRVRQLALPALAPAVPWARRMAGHALREWGLEELSDTALLLVSELVTNAVRASREARCLDGRPAGLAEIVLTLWLTGTSMLIEVWDACPDPAIRQVEDVTVESGRGLLIVETLASSWGQRAVDVGKVVWCEIGLLPAAVAAGARPRSA